MQLLLDTHAFLWWLSGDDALSAAAQSAIADENNGIFISAASAWEIATKYRIEKLPGVAAIVADIEGVIADQGFVGLPIGLSGEARRAARCPPPRSNGGLQ